MKKSEPVHVTEISTFLKCRLLWFWKAPQPRGLNLEPIVPVTNLALGRHTHGALQAHYDLGVPSSGAFTEIASGWLKDLHGWSDKLEEATEACNLMEDVLEAYDNWAEVADANLQVVATETNWRINVAPRLKLSGRFDALVRRPDGLWVLDFKTTSFDKADWTRTDLQATCYTMAARALYGPKVRGMIFRFIKKKAPWSWDKLILKNGSVTTRNNIANLTTLANFELALAVMAMNSLNIYDNLEECADAVQANDLKEWEGYERFHEPHTNVRRLYWPQIQTLKGAKNPYFWEVEEIRTPVQVNKLKLFILIPAMREMYSKRKNRWIGPTGLGSAWASCSRCAFKHPCRMVMEGADFRSYLSENYTQRIRDYSQEVKK